MKIVMLIIAGLFLTACAAGPELVMKRAPFDLQCSAEDITVNKFSYRTWGASGCGKTETYVMTGECSVKYLSYCEARKEHE